MTICIFKSIHTKRREDSLEHSISVAPGGGQPSTAGEPNGPPHQWEGPSPSSPAISNGTLSRIKDLFGTGNQSSRLIKIKGKYFFKRPETPQQQSRARIREIEFIIAKNMPRRIRICLDTMPSRAVRDNAFFWGQ